MPPHSTPSPHNTHYSLSTPISLPISNPPSSHSLLLPPSRPPISWTHLARPSRVFHPLETSILFPRRKQSSHTVGQNYCENSLLPSDEFSSLTPVRQYHQLPPRLSGRAIHTCERSRQFLRSNLPNWGRRPAVAPRRSQPLTTRALVTDPRWSVVHVRSPEFRDGPRQLENRRVLLRHDRRRSVDTRDHTCPYSTTPVNGSLDVLETGSSRSGPPW